VLGGWHGPAAERLAARLHESRDRAGDRGPAPPAGVVLAGNVPGLAAQTVLPALLAGRPLLIKSASSEPLFAPALIGALARREPALGEAFAAFTFPGEAPEATEAAFSHAELVLAYGGQGALTALRERLERKPGRRFVGQGPKASVALVGGRHDPLSTGRALARDIALLDQRGCLS